MYIYIYILIHNYIFIIISFYCLWSLASIIIVLANSITWREARYPGNASRSLGRQSRERDVTERKASSPLGRESRNVGQFERDGTGEEQRALGGDSRFNEAFRFYLCGVSAADTNNKYGYNK